MSRIRLQVSRKLIDWALQQNNSQCAISCAIRDADFYYPRVTQTRISFTDRDAGVRYTWPTPSKVAEWIDGFDRDRTLTQPLAINLDTQQAKVTPLKRRRDTFESVAAHENYKRRKVQSARSLVKEASNTQRPLRED